MSTLDATDATDRLVFEAVLGLPDDWDELATTGGGAFTRAWIELARGRVPGDLHTFVVRSGDDTLVALVGGVMAEQSHHVRFDPVRVLSGGSAADGVAEDGPHPWRDIDPGDLLSSAVVMFPNYETVPIGPAHDDPAALDCLLAGIEGWAATQGARSVAHLFVRGDHEPYLDALRRRDHAVVAMAERGDLDVAWDDFDGYVARLPGKRRFAVRRERRELAERGVTLRATALPDDPREHLALRAQLMAKYGVVVDPETERRSIHVLRNAFGPGDVTVIEARACDGALLSFALIARAGASWTVLMSGTDYTHPSAGFTYFAVMFYLPAELAPGAGIERIVFGLGSLEAKRLRGCALTGLFAAGKQLPG